MRNKILIGLMAFALCFTFTSCGNKTEEKDAVDAAEKVGKALEKEFGDAGVRGSDQKGDGLDNVTEENYAKVMKANFGFEPIYGDGWTVKEVSSPNKVNNLRLNYKTPNDIVPDEWTKKYFDAAMAVSTDGVRGMIMDMNTGKVSKSDKLANYESYKSGKYWGWYYEWNGREIQFNPSIFPGDALVSFVFVEKK